MKLKLISNCAILLGLVAFSGCAAFKQDTLSKPIDIDGTANYKYGLHALDGEGNLIKDADSFELKDVGKNDSFSHNVSRTYFDPYRAKIEGYRAAAQIASSSAADGEFTEGEFTIAGLMFEAAANEQMGQYVATEDVDAARTNDANAQAQARIAQFQQKAQSDTERFKRMFDTVDNGIAIANPVGAAVNTISGAAGNFIANSSAQRRAQPEPVPVNETEEAVE